MDRIIGTTLRARYSITKKLAIGGFGETYLAEDLDLPDRPLCVVKRLVKRYSDKAKELFDREAKVLYQLGEHPQIPRLLARFDENAEFYLVQEFIEGCDLSQEIIEGQPWDEFQVISLLRDILEILTFVHQNGVIHRDINPKNIIRRQTDDKLVLIDFGAVKEVCTLVDDRGQPKTTVAVGNPCYMPSEQCNGNPRLSSDIYAVGMMSIQALTGLHPLYLNSVNQENEITWRNQAKVSTNLANILDTMVRYDFRDRYPSAAEAFQTLQSLVISG